jgi:single-strand DNA-binding protein
MFNKVILVGNLTRDIELRYSQSGMSIAKTAIATSRKFTSNGEKKEEVCFIDVTFFGRSAEIANQYLNKGSKILVEGRLNFEQWVDQNGGKRSKHSVTVENMQMLDSRSDSHGSQHVPQYEQQNVPAGSTQDAGRGMQQNTLPEIEVSEETIPF